MRAVLERSEAVRKYLAVSRAKQRSVRALVCLLACKGLCLVANVSLYERRTFSV